MEHRMLERGDIFMAIEGGKSRISADMENMPEGKRHTVKEIEALAEGERPAFFKAGRFLSCPHYSVSTSPAFS